MRAVVDTSVLVRALIKPSGTVGPVLTHLRAGDYVLLYSQSILEELVDVLSRPRLRVKYGIDDEAITTTIELILLRGEGVEPTERIAACRDPKDDKFLEVAVAGKADALATGDEDLLTLHPFQDIPIVQPAAFLSMLRR
jgi:uncharacterized protein